MPTLSRRHWLAIATSQLALSGFHIPRAFAATPPALVDVHCHLFNASDLPAEKFMRIVVLELYQKPGRNILLDLKRSDIVDVLIGFFLALVGNDGAPTAAHEIQVLTGKAPARQEFVDDHAADRRTIELVGHYLSPTAALVGSNSSGHAAFRQALLKAGGAQTSGKSSPKALAASPLVAERAYFSPTDIGRYLRWFTLFTRYRYVLADKLIAFYGAQGYTAKLLCPAMIDYSLWLDEKTRSPLSDQVTVMDLVARRQTKTAVHGYVAFDPLRQAMHDAGDEPSDPLAVVRSGVEDHGLIGVKLYPPMGFRPLSNSPLASAYPKHVKFHGAALDAALAKLYDYCSGAGVPILAHAQDSNGAGPSYADRADPAFWLEVFDRWPRLRVCLAHFGSFTAKAGEGTPSAPPPKEQTWEWAFGAYLKAHPDSPIYRDISYLSEVWISDPIDRKRIRTDFRAYVDTFDPQCDHLLFGTDWVMLASEAKAKSYAKDVASFLRKEVGLTDTQMEKILFSNAVRFLGLGQGAETRTRLLAHYKRFGMNDALLPVI